MPLITLPNGQQIDLSYENMQGQMAGQQVKPPPQQIFTNQGGYGGGNVQTDQYGNTTVYDQQGNPTGGGIVYTPPPQTGAQNTAGAQVQTTTPVDYSNTIQNTFQQQLGRAASANDIAHYQAALAAGLSPQEFSGQIGASAEAQNFQNMNAQNAAMQASQQQGMTQAASAPPTGLIGAEQALSAGLRGGIAGIQEGMGSAIGGIRHSVTQNTQNLGQAQRGFNPYMQAGRGAVDLQAALSGAMGQQAQADAYANYNQSPGQRYLQQEAERSLLRNQAAIGGLGGGNVRRALQEQAIGLAQQDFGNAFNRLGSLSGQGLAATGARGQLAGQLAALNQQGSIAQGNLYAQGGLAAAQLAQQTGQDMAQNRFQTGRDIAQAVSGTTSALAGLADAQGTGLSSITESGGINLANILSGAGQLDAAQQQQLATILANAATQQGTNQAIIGQNIGQAVSNSAIGQAAGQRAGIAQLAAAASGFNTGGLSGALNSFMPTTGA